MPLKEMHFKFPKEEEMESITKNWTLNKIEEKYEPKVKERVKVFENKDKFNGFLNLTAKTIAETIKEKYVDDALLERTLVNLHNEDCKAALKSLKENDTRMVIEHYARAYAYRVVLSNPEYLYELLAKVQEIKAKK